ncbi:thiamine transport system ATP-binding protein [Loktanella ponticola]|uniref:Thiamine transport system ATP-binding protein n=1 Tax=Yoonia ponticola TaxID=1524255 RepID=A0A7W9BHB0_9RHOB|nr:ATP-binding cassette domain-containing protein [Yoonia ponticola]MBB5720553.1 thiamine transport system ATP-binding protein [Yoonia ponticola]
MLTFDAVTLSQGTFQLTADFQLQADITAVIGPSGGGKSTLLAGIAGFFEPSKGRVLWDNQVLTGTSPAKRPVNMLFQDNNLFPHLTIQQNVGLGLRPDLRLTQDQKQMVADTLDHVGLTDLGARKPAALSGGQQSRAALARVLVSQRPLVLLDEPFAALGPAMKDDMLRLVRETLVQAGKSVVIVTHDPDDARRFADQVILVADGVAHAPVSSEEIFANPPPALRAYLG